MKKKPVRRQTIDISNNPKHVSTNEYVPIDTLSKFKYTTATIPYVTAIFLGAFLLFLVQPMIGKYILPWFGGMPAVWTTCMLFFQVVLLAGYGYAHWTSSFFRPRNQAIVHVIILLCCLAFLPIIPADGWKPLGFESPLPRILALLVVTLGLPYLLLSSTGPLLQSWFTLQLPGVSPYRL
jgi:phosphatidylserine synthase